MTLEKDFIYFDGNDFKEIEKITDDLDDATVNLLGRSSDSQIDNEVFPFADQLPLIEINLTTARSAALYYALSKWSAQNNNVEKATYYSTQYTNEIEKLVGKLKSQHTGRTRTVAVSRDYDTESLLFSQTLR